MLFPAVQLFCFFNFRWWAQVNWMQPVLVGNAVLNPQETQWKRMINYIFSWFLEKNSSLPEIFIHVLILHDNVTTFFSLKSSNYQLECSLHRKHNHKSNPTSFYVFRSYSITKTRGHYHNGTPINSRSSCSHEQNHRVKYRNHRGISYAGHKHWARGCEIGIA